MKYYKVGKDFFEIAEPPPVEEAGEIFEWPTGEITKEEFAKGLAGEAITGGGTLSARALVLTAGSC